jgi:hypothetical protein
MSGFAEGPGRRRGRGAACRADVPSGRRRSRHHEFHARLHARGRAALRARAGAAGDSGRERHQHAAGADDDPDADRSSALAALPARLAAHLLYGASAINEAVLDRAMQQLPACVFTQLMARPKCRRRACSALKHSITSAREQQAALRGPAAHRRRGDRRRREGEECCRPIMSAKSRRAGPARCSATGTNPIRPRRRWAPAGCAAATVPTMDEDGFLFVVDRSRT